MTEDYDTQGRLPAGEWWPAWEDRPPQVEDRHPFGSPEYNAAFWSRHPHRRGLSGDAQRQSAQKDEGTLMNDKANGVRCDTPSCRYPDRHHNHDPGRPALPPIWRG